MANGEESADSVGMRTMLRCFACSLVSQAGKT